MYREEKRIVYDDTDKPSRVFDIVAKLKRDYPIQMTTLTAVKELKSPVYQRAFILAYAEQLKERDPKISEEKRYATIANEIRFYLLEVHGKLDEKIPEVKSWISSIGKYCKPEDQQETFMLLR